MRYSSCPSPIGPGVACKLQCLSMNKSLSHSVIFYHACGHEPLIYLTNDMARCSTILHLLGLLPSNPVARHALRVVLKHILTLGRHTLTSSKAFKSILHHHHLPLRRSYRIWKTLLWRSMPKSHPMPLGPMSHHWLVWQWWVEIASSAQGTRKPSSFDHLDILFVANLECP